MVRKNSATTRETAVTYPSSESDSPLVGEHIIHRKPGFKKMTQGLLYLFLFPLNKSIPIRLNTTQLESLAFLETGSLPSVSLGYRQGVCPMGSFWRPRGLFPCLFWLLGLPAFQVYTHPLHHLNFLLPSSHHLLFCSQTSSL